MRINEPGSYIPARRMGPAAANQKQAGKDEMSAGAAVETAPTQIQDIVDIFTENTRPMEPPANQQRAARSETDEMNRLLKSANAQTDAVGESADVLRKCLIIAARIIAGDEVPREDHRYLAKHDPERYINAISLRKTRKKAKRHKRISDDEAMKNPFDAANGRTGSRRPDTGGIVELSSGQTAPAVHPEDTTPPV